MFLVGLKRLQKVFKSEDVSHGLGFQVVILFELVCLLAGFHMFFACFFVGVLCLMLIGSEEGRLAFRFVVLCFR